MTKIAIAEQAEQLAETRIRLQQAIDERDALKYELESWRDIFHLSADDEKKKHGSFIINVWLKCVGNRCAPKSHLIDGLSITTRRLKSLDVDHF